MLIFLFFYSNFFSFYTTFFLLSAVLPYSVFYSTLSFLCCFILFRIPLPSLLYAYLFFPLFFSFFHTSPLYVTFVFFSSISSLVYPTFFSFQFYLFSIFLYQFLIFSFLLSFLLCIEFSSMLFYPFLYSLSIVYCYSSCY